MANNFKVRDLIADNVIINGDITTVDSITFDTAAVEANAVGKLKWNDEDGTLDLGLKGGNVTLQVGQETVIRAVNKTNANLLEANYQVARIRTEAEGGSQGQRLAIVLAQANNDNNSVDTLGLVTENIDNNQEGFVTTFGLVRGINTTGSLQGEDWNDGDVLYLSPTIAGRLTKVKPQAPQHTVIVGFVVYSHINNGKIFVKVDNGYEIDELHNVKINGVTNNSLLAYDSLSGVWKNTNSINVDNITVSGQEIYYKKDIIYFTGNNFTPNANLARTFEYVLTGLAGASATLNAPINMGNGENIVIKIKQSPSGSNHIIFNSNYKFPGGVIPSLTLTPDKADIYTALKIDSNFYSTYIKDFIN